MDKLTHLYVPTENPPLAPQRTFFFGLLGTTSRLRYLLPLLILVHPRFKKTIKGVMIASFSVVIGIFGERFSLIIQELPILCLFIQENRGILGAAGSFPFTPVESLMSIGVLRSWDSFLSLD